MLLGGDYADITLFPGYAQINHDGDAEYGCDNRYTIDALVGLTSWVLYDEKQHRLCAQSIACADCGHTLWGYRDGEHQATYDAPPAPPERCPACSSDALVFAPESPPKPAVLPLERSARRLLDALMRCGGLEVTDEAALFAPLVDALDADEPPTRRAERLADALLASPAVMELYLSNEQLTGVLAAW